MTKLTVKEFAESAEISGCRVRQLINAGVIVASRDRMGFLISKSELRKFEKNRRAPGRPRKEK